MKVVTQETSERLFADWATALGVPSQYDDIRVEMMVAEQVGKSLKLPETTQVELDQFLLPDVWAVGQVKVINGKKVIPIYLSQQFLDKVTNEELERYVNDLVFQTLMALQVKDKTGVLYSPEQIETLNKLLQQESKPFTIQKEQTLNRNGRVSPCKFCKASLGAGELISIGKTPPRPAAAGLFLEFLDASITTAIPMKISPPIKGR